MFRAYEFKLKPNKHQAKVLEEWLALACRIFNQALEDRIRYYHDHGKQLCLYDQYTNLTQWRSQVESICMMSVDFERDVLRRVDNGMKRFFNRYKSGEKPGFPRFKNPRSYSSIECNAINNYMRGRKIYVPKLGLIRAYSGSYDITGTQKILRIVRRASGWYAQIVADDCKLSPEKLPVISALGIDVGLTSFTTTNNGEKIANPRWMRQEDKRIKRIQQKLSRAKRGSHNRRKVIIKLRRMYEKVSNRRKDFLHQSSRKIINNYDLIAVEDLKINKMIEKGNYSKGISDCSWGKFLYYLTYKAESAGKQVVRVNPRNTSQECSSCDSLVPKSIQERVHRCTHCGLILDRDVNAARNILARAVGPANQNACGGHEVVAVEAGRV